MTDWAVTAAVAMIPSDLASIFVLAPGLLVPMVAVPVALTTGGGVVLTRRPCLLNSSSNNAR